MSQQLFSRYPADVVKHGKLGAHLGLLMPPLAALLYPFLLEAFHANIAPVISGQSAEPALQSAAATLFLLLALAGLKAVADHFGLTDKRRTGEGA